MESGIVIVVALQPITLSADIHKLRDNRETTSYFGPDLEKRFLTVRAKMPSRIVLPPPSA